MDGTRTDDEYNVIFFATSPPRTKRGARSTTIRRGYEDQIRDAQRCDDDHPAPENFDELEFLIDRADRVILSPSRAREIAEAGIPKVVPHPRIGKQRRIGHGPASVVRTMLATILANIEEMSERDTLDLLCPVAITIARAGGWSRESLEAVVNDVVADRKAVAR
jgi:hypothetical protein